MKLKSIVLLCSIAIIAVLLSSCTSAPPATATPTGSEGVDIQWHGLGKGPQGWVVGIDVRNNTSEPLNMALLVTVTDGNGDEIGTDTVKIEDLAANSYWSYPVHCEKAELYNVTWEEIDAVDKPTSTAPVVNQTPNPQSPTNNSLSPAETTPNIVDLSAISESIWTAFSESFGYPGFETSWFKYVDSITVEELDGKYYAIAIVNTDDQELIEKIGNIIYGNYCFKDFEGIDIYASLVYDADYNSLFSRTD